MKNVVFFHAFQSRNSVKSLRIEKLVFLQEMYTGLISIFSQPCRKISHGLRDSTHQNIVSMTSQRVLLIPQVKYKMTI